MGDLHQGRILAAHADQGPHVRPHVDRPQCLADDLEFVMGPELLTDHFPVAARERDGNDLIPPECRVELVDERGHCSFDFAEVTPVRGLADDLLVRVDHDAVEADGADIYSGMQLADGWVLTGLRWFHGCSPLQAELDCANLKSKRRTRRKRQSRCG